MNKIVRWLKQHLPGWRRYWSQRGVVPRWQYLLVYILIVAAGIFGELQTSRIANRANQAVHEIQRSRIEITRSGCVQQNRRNEAAFRFLRDLPEDPRQHHTVKGRDILLHGFTDALIGPPQNCQQLIKHRFGSVR